MAAASNSPSATAKPDTLGALWRTIIRFESAKVAPWIAFRNAIGIAIPLAGGVALGNPPAGIVCAMGALNVSFSDGTDPYFRRAGRMLAATGISGLAVFIGAMAGENHGFAIALTALWAFAASMLLALDNAAADIGLISLVTVVVFTARTMSVEEAALSGLLAMGGGLLQTSLAVSLWPLRRYEPERRVLGELYSALANLAAASVNAMEAPPVSSEFTQAHKLLSGLTGFRSTQRERYWSLLNQAERIRLGLLMLVRLRERLGREPDTAPDTEVLNVCRELASRILEDVGAALLRGGAPVVAPDALSQFSRVAESYREARHESAGPGSSALRGDARFQLDALEGQLRAVIHLAAYSTPAGRAVFERREALRPWALRLAGSLAILRANLSLDSSVFRHAIRVAICVAVGDTLARSLGWERSYWMPMTIAIILKPDFAATFSRGVLRLAGTAVGLIIATVLFHLLAPTLVLEVVLIALMAFMMRCFGPANYGILVIAISALVVLLFAMTGVTPAEVIASRGLNTAVGGVLALLVYAVWPTWERSQISENLARLLDAYRGYFRGIRNTYVHPHQDRSAELDRVRVAARLARSNLEGSVERFGSEPRSTVEALDLLKAMLASSHRLAHAIMALEAGLTAGYPAPPREAFLTFANHVELILHSLAGSLRGYPLKPADLPDLREDHHALIQSGDALTERYALINVESDRITNSLNTLTGQLLHWRTIHAPE